MKRATILSMMLPMVAWAVGSITLSGDARGAGGHPIDAVGVVERAPSWSVAAAVGGSVLSPSLDYALEGSRRWGRFAALAKVDWNQWVNTQKPPSMTWGSLNVGGGAGYWYFGGRARASVVMGPSILLFRTVLDKPGRVGLFLDCFPASLSWALKGPLHLRLDPLSFHVVAPVLDAIPLVVLEYRTSLALEWRL